MKWHYVWLCLRKQARLVHTLTSLCQAVSVAPYKLLKAVVVLHSLSLSTN